MKTQTRTIHIDQLYTQDAFLSFCNDDHTSGYGNKLGVKITPEFLLACEKDEFIVPVCVQDKVKYYSPFQIFIIAELCHNVVDEDGFLRDGDLMDLAYQKEHKTRYINWGGQSAFNINNRNTEKDTKSKILNQFSLTKDFNNFVNEYKEQMTVLLPIAEINLFMKKYNKPLGNLETLKSFHELSKTFSDLFEIDMSDKYADFVTSFEQEIRLINHSFIMALDNVSSFIYTKMNKKYPIEIIENNFTFDIEDKSENKADGIIESYKEALQKIGF